MGRAILKEFSPDWQIRSVHRHPVPGEAAAQIEWIPQDIGAPTDWSRLLSNVDLVINVAWYRYGSVRRFRPLAQGLIRCIYACEKIPGLRFLHLSVPDAPESMEQGLPYLTFKRRVDRALEASSLDYAILRPSMLFGPGDRLLTVMLRLLHRYGRFPMFGDGNYHVSPLAASDLAAILRREAGRAHRSTQIFGGPERWRYRDLTDRMFAALGLPPKYIHLSPRQSIWLARLIQGVGSSLIYAYEIEWLLSDRLGPEPYSGLDRPLAPVAPFLDRMARSFLG